MIANKTLCMTIVFVVFGVSSRAEEASGTDVPPVLESYRRGKMYRASVGVLPESTGVALVLYSTPGNREMVRTVVDTVNKIVHDKDAVFTWFVVDASGSPIPGPLLRHMLKRASKKSPSTTYCIDLNNSLPRRWGLPDNGAGVLVLNPGGVVLFNSTLPMNEKDFSALSETLNRDY